MSRRRSVMTVGRGFAETFRNAMAGVCTPVAVVTASDQRKTRARDDDGQRAFTSLSMTPPMILVSLDRGSDLLRLLREPGVLANVLASDQADLAMRFATKGDDKFSRLPWKAPNGVPRIRGSVAFLACEVADFVDGGDHVVVLGMVLAAETSPAPPLTYHNRRIGTHAALEEVSP